MPGFIINVSFGGSHFMCIMDYEGLEELFGGFLF